MKLKKLEANIKIPEKVSINIENRIIKVKGEKGENERKLFDKRIKIETKDKNLIISSKNVTKREKEKIGSFKAHIKNMIKGATEGHIYKLKICSGHFPMNVAVKNNQLIIKNFLGEKVPRVLNIKEGVNIKINGSEVIVDGLNKEFVAQSAASIEQTCKISNRDKRVFQDGIYIINKDGKEIK